MDADSLESLVLHPLKETLAILVFLVCLENQEDMGRKENQVLLGLLDGQAWMDCPVAKEMLVHLDH